MMQCDDWLGFLSHKPAQEMNLTRETTLYQKSCWCEKVLILLNGWFSCVVCDWEFLI